MSAIDMHLRTTASSGSYTYEQVFAYVRNHAVRLFSITDLDIPQTITVPDDLENQYVPGMEVEAHLDGRPVRLLVYGKINRDSIFAQLLSAQRLQRKRQVRAMLRCLAGCGIRLSFTELMLEAGPYCRSVTPEHVARVLVRNKVVTSCDEAFETLLGYGKHCHVPMHSFPAWQVIEIAHNCGAMVILAHPLALADPNDLPRLCAIGIDGLQTRGSDLDGQQSEQLEFLARSKGLLVSGCGCDEPFGDEGRRPVHVSDDRIEEFCLALSATHY